jgi:hypothetical protein
VARTS